MSSSLTTRRPSILNTNIQSIYDHTIHKIINFFPSPPPRLTMPGEHRWGPLQLHNRWPPDLSEQKNSPSQPTSIYITSRYRDTIVNTRRYTLKADSKIELKLIDCSTLIYWTAKNNFLSIFIAHPEMYGIIRTGMQLHTCSK